MRLTRTAAAAALLLGATVAALAVGPRVRLAPALTGAAALENWERQHPDAWAIEDGALVLKTAGKPGGPIRKPAEWAILRSAPLGDFTLTAEIRSDRPESLKGRDVLVFFGYQSPTRFYYAHLSNDLSAPHNGVFLVNDADRKRLDPLTSTPLLRDRKWHRVRVVRTVGDGSIAVYLDESREPILKATDTTLRSGRVGFGSFDDVAAFRNVVVQGDVVEGTTAETPKGE